MGAAGLFMAYIEKKGIYRRHKGVYRECIEIHMAVAILGVGVITTLSVSPLN